MMKEFRLGMFDLDKVKKYSDELITYRGHLPYYILSVLPVEDIKRRNNYLKNISDERYSNEREVLKSERKNNKVGLENLQYFLKINPEYQDIIQSQYRQDLI